MYLIYTNNSSLKPGQLRMIIFGFFVIWDHEVWPRPGAPPGEGINVLDALRKQPVLSFR